MNHQDKRALSVNYKLCRQQLIINAPTHTERETRMHHFYRMILPVAVVVAVTLSCVAPLLFRAFALDFQPFARRQMWRRLV